MNGRWHSLYDRMLSEDALRAAFRKVKQSKGAPGVDGQTVEAFEADLEREVRRLEEELRAKTYRPQPVRRVEIPKPTGGVRKLGVPAVRDRVVQQVLLNVLTPIFEPTFHPSSYGYRPKRSCHDAIAKAWLFIEQYKRRWVVDMDLSKCFDTLDHDLIIEAFRREIADGSVLGLIRMFLTSGVKTGWDEWEASEVGSPQGGVISPLIANVYLDAFDQWMKRHGHRIVRYADDILILCRSRAAAEHAFRRATAYLEGPLRLRVNREKTRLRHSDEGAPYLGVVLYTTHIEIAPEKVKRFRDKVRQLTSRRRQGDMVRVIRELNRQLRGFGNYFRIAHWRNVFVGLMGWVRRRLRMLQLIWWKTPRRWIRRLRQIGWRNPPDWIGMRSWRASRRPEAHAAMSNAYFASLGLYDMSRLRTGCPVVKRSFS